MNEIDEKHELLMRAIDESRPLSDIEDAIQSSQYFEFMQDKYDRNH